jgi:hypothetical protein
MSANMREGTINLLAADIMHSRSMTAGETNAGTGNPEVFLGGFDDDHSLENH